MRLTLVLQQPQDVADGHGQHRQDPEQLRGDRGSGSIQFGAADGEQQLDQRDEAAGLGDEREERGDRRGGALVDVAGVEVQRDGGDLEREPGERASRRRAAASVRQRRPVDRAVAVGRCERRRDLVRFVDPVVP